MSLHKTQLIEKIRHALHELNDIECIVLINEIEDSDRPSFRLLNKLIQYANEKYDKSLALVSNIQDLAHLYESEGD